MHDLVVTPQVAPLVGSVPVPSDSRIAHRALLFAALAGGASEIRRFSYAEDNQAAMRALRALGVVIEDDGAGHLCVHGASLQGLRAPSGPVDCADSGTTMRLLAGLLVAQPFQSQLIGAERLSRRPMADVANPLRRRGAQIEGIFSPGSVGEITAPLTVGPLPEGVLLSELEHRLAVPSADVKSALLLSGLYADGATYVKEPTVSCDHTERMMRALGVPLSTAGSIVHFDAAAFDGKLPPFGIDIPGDFSAAALVIGAGLLVPGSRVCARGVGLNPTRTGALDVWRRMGAAIEVSPGERVLEEPLGDLCASWVPLSATVIGGEVVSRAIDDLPILCALAARAKGITDVDDAAEFRGRGGDLLAKMADLLRAFGVGVEARSDGLTIEGRPEGPLRAADFDARGDQRIAMTGAVLALLADAPSLVRGVDSIATSFPRFAGTLRALGARVKVVPR